MPTRIVLAVSDDWRSFIVLAVILIGAWKIIQVLRHAHKSN